MPSSSRSLTRARVRAARGPAVCGGRAARPGRGFCARSRDPSPALRGRSAPRATCSRLRGCDGTTGDPGPRRSGRSSSLTSAWMYAAIAIVSSTPGHRVHDADLDACRAGVRPDVPPDVGVVGDAARLLELAHDLCVVLVVAEARWRPGARERGEDHVAAGGEAGRLAAPERGAAPRGRAARPRWARSALIDLDRLLGVVDRDVDVAAEDELPPRDVLELIDEGPVAVAGGDPLALEEAERVRAGRAEPQALAPSPSRTCARSFRAARESTSPAVRQTGVAISRTDCMSSGDDRVCELAACSRRRAASPRAATRSNVSGSRSMYSSSTPSVKGGDEPKL